MGGMGLGMQHCSQFQHVKSALLTGKFPAKHFKLLHLWEKSMLALVATIGMANRTPKITRGQLQGCGFGSGCAATFRVRLSP